jgi:Flp pilus assembly protein TadD
MDRGDNQRRDAQRDLIWILHGRPQDALPVAQDLARAPNADADDIDRLADCWLALGRQREAEEQYRRAIRQSATPGRLHRKLGGLLFQQGRHPEAVECFQEAVRLDPDNGEALEGLSTVLSQCKRLPEAEAALRKSIRIQATWSRISVLVGMLAAQGRIPDACQTLHTGLRHFPDDRKIREQIVDRLIECGEAEEALGQSQAMRP